MLILSIYFIRKHIKILDHKDHMGDEFVCFSLLCQLFLNEVLDRIHTMFFFHRIGPYTSGRFFGCF